MKSWNDSTRNKICPDTSSRSFIRIVAKELGSMIEVRFFQKFAEHRALVEWFVVVLKCGDEAARIELEERFRFVVRVDFDVLVWNVLLFEGNPHALDEGAEPAGVELQRIVGGVGLVELESPSGKRKIEVYLDSRGCETSGVGMEVCIWVVFTHGVIRAGDRCLNRRLLSKRWKKMQNRNAQKATIMTNTLGIYPLPLNFTSTKFITTSESSSL
jgi:hypothetical protein